MRLTIITLTLDAPPYFEEAMASVEAVDTLEIEHLIVHDGDAAFAQSLAKGLPAIKVLEGEGAGATAAAIRGVEAVTGDFIIFLHSDDRLLHGALALFHAAAIARPEVKIWTGGARIFSVDEDGREALVRSVTRRELTELTLQNVCDGIPLLSARFCHRSVYGEIGNFDPRFSECSDREFLLRAVMAKVPEGALDGVVSELRQHEGSRTIHRRRGVVPPYLSEHIKIADMWLARPDLSRKTRRFLRNWRAREVTRLIFHCIINNEWNAAASTVCSVGRSDPYWIFRAVTLLMARERRRAGRGRLIESVRAADSWGLLRSSVDRRR